jgi:hypothetical protein
MVIPAIRIAPALLALAVFPIPTEGDTGPRDSVAKGFEITVNGDVSADRAFAVFFDMLDQVEGSEEVDGPLSTSDTNRTSCINLRCTERRCILPGADAPSGAPLARSPGDNGCAHPGRQAHYDRSAA